MRNKWLCSNMELWTVEETEKALAEIEKLIGMIPGLSSSYQMPAASFNSNGFHTKVQKFRSCIESGQHEKIQFKIQRLQSLGGREIYVERSYKESNTEERTSSVNDILLPDKTVLLKGEAGAGKSSVASKLIQRWAEGEEAKDLACILFLSYFTKVHVQTC